jgi:DNA-binding MarR family transcriptional regulator
MLRPDGRTRCKGGQAPGPDAMMNSGPVHDGAAQVAEPDAGALLRLEDFLPHKLNVLSSLVSQALTRVYGQRYGIGIPEWRVLVTLGQYGVMTGKQVGAHTHMHKTKVSRAVAQLEQRKYVGRRANRADLREAFLSLTPTGRAIYEEAAPIALDFTNRLSEVVAPSDRAAFDRAMRLLTERSAKLVIEIAGAES